MEEGLRVEPLLLLIERIQLRWFRHLTKMPPGWGVLGSSYRNEAPGQTQGMLERLHLSWPENASMSPWIRWRSGYGEGGLDFLARAVAPTTEPWISSSWRMFYQRRRRQILCQCQWLILHGFFFLPLNREPVEYIPPQRGCFGEKIPPHLSSCTPSLWSLSVRVCWHHHLLHSARGHLLPLGHRYRRP